MSIRNDLAERDLLDVAVSIARQHNVTVDELCGHSRERAPCWARQALWAHCYALGHWSYPRLGKLFERDHRTIIDGVRKHLNRTGYVLPTATVPEKRASHVVAACAGERMTGYDRAALEEEAMGGGLCR